MLHFNSFPTQSFYSWFVKQSNNDNCKDTDRENNKAGIHAAEQSWDYVISPSNDHNKIFGLG
jgi:hypothetical protein